MKLYTRTGDDGTTGLFAPVSSDSTSGRVGKDHPRIESLGCVDELNAAVGLAGSACTPDRDFHRRLLEIFSDLQSRLFDVGADLATPIEQGKGGHESKIVRINEADVRQVEKWIDEIDGQNAPMKNFVLPGGCELAARLHLARTVCRRGERAIVGLAKSEPVNAEVIVYINRVSDLLFAMARRANSDAGVPDVPWTPSGRTRNTDS